MIAQYLRLPLNVRVAGRTHPFEKPNFLTFVLSFLFFNLLFFFFGNASMTYLLLS